MVSGEITMGCKDNKNSQWSISSSERGGQSFGQSFDRSTASGREAITAQKAEGKIAPPANLTSVLRGGNAPKQKINRDALFKRRGPPQLLPVNAPATNYRAAMPSNRQFTVQQEKLVSNLIGIQGKADAKVHPTWLARLFG